MARRKMSAKQINEQIAKLHKLEEDAASIKKQVDAIKDKLKEELVIQDTESIDTGAHRVFWTSYEKTIVDVERLKDDLLYATYSKKQQINQFKITDVAVV